MNLEPLQEESRSFEFAIPFRLSLSEGMKELRKGPLNHLSNVDVDMATPLPPLTLVDGQT